MDKLFGYGHITKKRVNTKVRHHFLDFTVAKPVDIELIYRQQVKDMFMIFLMIPNNQVWVECLITALCRNKAFFSILPENCRNAQALKIFF